jgi:hypothetical protein
MTLKLIFNITLTFIIIYIFFIYNVEHATDVSDNKTGGSTSGQSNTQFSDQQKKDITNIINDLYMTDVDAIRNLSDVATKLQTQDKLILPGQLNVQGKLTTNGLNPSDMPTGWTGGLRFIDGYASGNMGFGPNATTINAQINKDGNIMGKNLNLNGKIVTNDLTFNNSFTSGNMNFGPNDTTVNAQINKDGNITFVNSFTSGNMNFGPNATTVNAQINKDGNIKFVNGSATGNMNFGPNDTTVNARIKQTGDIEGYNLNLKGGLSFINAQINKDGDIIGNNLTFVNSFTSGNMNFGPNDTTVNAQINKDGNIMGKNLNLNGKIVTNDLTFNNSFTSGNMFFGPNDTTVNAQIKNNGNIEGYNLNLKGGLSFVSFINNATTINAQIDNDGNISGNKLILKGELQTPNGHTFQSAGTQHIQGNGALYILYKDGLIVGKEREGSGNVSIQGKLQVGEDIDGNNLNLKSNLKVQGNIETPNGHIFKSAGVQHIQGDDILYILNKNQLVVGKHWNSSGNVTIQGKLQVDENINGNKLNLRDDITLINKTPTKSKWNISNTENNSNTKLSFTRIIGDTNKSAVLDLYENGDVNISGNLKVNNVLKTKNRARFIRVGNIQSSTSEISGNLIISDTTTPQTNNPLPEFEKNWSLIEIKVFDDKGVNIANGKKVTLKAGSASDNSPPTNITNNFITDSNNITNNIGVGYQGTGDRNQLEIDLGDEYDISQIQLFNTLNQNHTKRMNNTIVELISGTKDIPTEPKIINRIINTGLWDRIYSKEFML